MTIWRLLQLIGAGCLVVVVLTHVAETFKLFPIMGWGLRTSSGHYLDLISAVLGCTLLPLKRHRALEKFKLRPYRIFRLPRVTRIFQKSIFSKTTR